ncbi:MAG: tRNA pseudouridine(55) synthase TruB [Bacilli bacterium]|nr:tRNA pseudouridine(55) synthase TruB [Bacilli bacterium]
MKYKNNLNGIILVNKPKGITSRDVVDKVQKLLNTKAGHTGTLDPLARGVLVVCLGKATKLTDMLTSTSKEYIAEVTLGYETDTLDTEGKILEKKETNITKEQLKKVLKDFQTTYKQEVPKYSAVKVKGKKLYEYARKGEDVTLPKKEVTIFDLDILDYEKDTFSFYTKVSKGTYIRSLIRDICHKLNILGTMSNLARISQGKFQIKDAYTLEDIEKGNFKIIPMKDAVDIPVVKVKKEIKQKIINGQKLDFDYDKVLFTDYRNNELAIYKKVGKELKVWKMLYSEDKEPIKM